MEGWVGVRAVLEEERNSSLRREPKPGRPARILVIIMTEVFRILNVETTEKN